MKESLLSKKDFILQGLLYHRNSGGFAPLENNRQKFFLSLSLTKSRKIGFLTGFTLIELLIVVSIIAILVVTIFIKINPVKRFAETRNVRRWSEINSIADAIITYEIDHKGTFPPGITTGTAKMLGTATHGCDSCPAKTTDSACLDLSGYLVKAYLPKIPKDPNIGTDAKTGYYVVKSSDGGIEVGACDPELGETINTGR